MIFKVFFIFFFLYNCCKLSEKYSRISIIHYNREISEKNVFDTIDDAGSVGLFNP